MGNPITSDDQERFKKTFFEECAELLTSAEANLGVLSENADAEALNAVFRAYHSIKGGAGAFAFSDLVAFAHTLEAVLDGMRAGNIEVTREIVQHLLRANDVLADHIAAARDGTTVNPDRSRAVLAEITANPTTGPSAATVQTPPENHLEDARYQIRFAPGPNLLRHANDPLLLIRALKKLGSLSISADLDALPSLGALDSEVCRITWVFTLETDAAEATIRDVFEFVVDDCALDISRHTAKPSDSLRMTEPGNGAPAKAPASAALPAVSSIRVDTDKIDRLVNLVGELVITQAMLAQEASVFPVEQYPALNHGLEALSQTARELQESVMSVRAQPVKSVFVRMPRLVRDLASRLGKEVRLVISGEGTEIDKTVIEQLSDPLTHMIRNAVDHGIESPEVRRAAGKPPEGTITISAGHRSGKIVIEISDDGRGIDASAVLRKAQMRGLVPAGTSISDEEAANLIFLPGLSTADAVSDVSGRGVGMDVVKKNIHALGGRINVDTKPGRGSRFTLFLPLTLAVLDGMVVSVGRERYIIPLVNIVESLRPTAKDIHSLVGRGDVLQMRGEYIPLVHAHRLFAVDHAAKNPCEAIVVIVNSDAAGNVGLVVDELLGQQQVVIKSLESNFCAVPGISGATILGSGRVALIMDIAQIGGMAAPPRANSAIRPERTAPHQMH